MVNMELRTTCDCVLWTREQWDADTEPTVQVSQGTRLEYAGHVPGGFVLVKHKDYDELFIAAPFWVGL